MARSVASPGPAVESQPQPDYVNAVNFRIDHKKVIDGLGGTGTDLDFGVLGIGTFDEWVKKSLGKLKSLSPVRYSKEEKSETVAQFIYY